MDAATGVSLAAGAVVVVALVLTGPLVGAVDVGGTDRSELGDGTATVEAVSPEHPPAVTPGRFGTGVAYLRIPDVRVRLSSVSGRSRLVYRVSVPALGFERVGNRRLAPDARGTVTVGMADRAFEYARLDHEAYAASLAVRVQSFAVDRTVYRANVTVEVRASG